LNYLIFRIYFLLIKALFYALSVKLWNLLFQLFYLLVLLLNGLLMFFRLHFILHNVHLQILFIGLNGKSIGRINLSLTYGFIIIVDSILSLFSKFNAPIHILGFYYLNFRYITFWPQTIQFITLIQPIKISLFSVSRRFFEIKTWKLWSGFGISVIINNCRLNFFRTENILPKRFSIFYI